MRVKIECKEEDYQNYVDMFKEMGIEVSDNATHLFKDLRVSSTNINVFDAYGKHILFDWSDIYMMESTGRNVSILMKDQTYYTNMKLYELEAIIQDSDFLRINKSQIISCSKIRKVSPMLNSKLKVFLKNDMVVYVNRTYLSQFKNKIQERGD